MTQAARLCFFFFFNLWWSNSKASIHPEYKFVSKACTSFWYLKSHFYHNIYHSHNHRNVGWLNSVLSFENMLHHQIHVIQYELWWRMMQQLEEEINTWLKYCQIAEHIVHEYLASNRARWYLFLTMRCGYIFMFQTHAYLSTNLFSGIRDVFSYVHTLLAYSPQWV